MLFPRTSLFLPGAAVLLASGCGWVPRSQMVALEAQNNVLSEQTRAQLAEIENLRNHAHGIEDQLFEAEDELALLDEQYGIDRQKLANLRRERSRMRGLGLDLGDGDEGNIGMRGRLSRLARRSHHLHFDPRSGIAKLDTDVLFDPGEDVLKPGAKSMLREFASLMNDPDARQLKIMVVGHTDSQGIRGRETRHRFPTNWHLSSARALVVADALREAGLDGERLGVAGFAQHQPIASNEKPRDRQQNRRVEIFVTSPDVPVVGMTETLTGLY